jgi:hypothetical protein
VRYFANLSNEEKQEIELEENIRRKDLTGLERDKKIVALAEIAAAINADEESDFRLNANQKGRPKEPDSRRAIAERMGVDPDVIQRARTHVAAVEKYPELGNPTFPQKAVLTIAKNLDKLEGEDLVKARAGIRACKPSVLSDLAELPAVSPEDLKRTKSAAENWVAIMVRISRMLLSVHVAGGVAALTRNWSDQYKQSFYSEVVQQTDALHKLKVQFEKEVLNAGSKSTNKEVSRAIS